MEAVPSVCFILRELLRDTQIPTHLPLTLHLGHDQTELRPLAFKHLLGGSKD